RLPARGRVLGRALRHLRDRPDHRRAAQRQARAPRSAGRQPRRAAARRDPVPARGHAAPGSAAGRVAGSAARSPGTVAAVTSGLGAAVDRVIRTLPRQLRNRLAATILEAVDDVQARRALARLAGARSLLMEGAARLYGRRLGGRDFDAFARATAEAVTRLPVAKPPPFPELTTDASDREESV